MGRALRTASPVAAALVALAVTGCAAGDLASPSPTSVPRPAPVDRLDPYELNRALKCPLEPGPGVRQPVNPGSVVYDCAPNNGSEYAYIVFFSTEDAKHEYASKGARFATPGSAGGQMQVVSSRAQNWVVWGNIPSMIQKAVGLGGIQS